jgi:two-component system, sensor histidine kinase and response regulator
VLVGAGRLLRWSRGRVSANPHRWTALLLITLLAATAIATVYTVNVQRDDQSRRVSRQATVTIDALQRRLDAYSDVLVAVRGAVALNPDLSPRDFRTFVGGLQVRSRYPGIQAVWFAHVRNGHAIVTHIEPLAGNERALGFDALSEPARRAAFIASRASGRPAATGPVRLLQLPPDRKGLVLVLAIAERPGGPVTSVVAAAFDVRNLVGAIIGKRSEYDLELYDLGASGTGRRALSSKNMIYSNAGAPRALDGADGRHAVLRDIDISGRRWAVYYRPNGASAVPVGPSQWIVAVGGAIGSLLAAWLFLALARGRSHALALAGRRTRELETSERQTRQILETAPDAFVALDAHGRITDWNPQAHSAFGWTRDEVLGRPMTDALLIERDRPRIEEILAGPDDLDSGKLFELSALHCDGHELQIELSIASLCGEQGRTFNVFVRDISERVQAQHKFEQFVEFAPDAIVGVGEDGAIVLVNAQVERVFGYTRGELLGQRIEVLIPERFRPAHAGHRGEFFADPGTRPMGAQLTLFARRKDGSEFPAEISLSSIETADGLLATAAVRDITERELMQTELQTRERQTRQILETAHDAFISIDESGVITDWNPQAEATFGWSRDEVVGRTLAETIVPPALREAHSRGLDRFMKTGVPRVLGRLIELTAIHRDGHEFPVELTISPLRTDSGYMFNAFLRDITERTRTQEQLALAHEQAVEASRMKSDFVANMSHEIRTPLNGVIGLTGLLVGTDLDDEQRDYAESLQASGDALMAVISDILDFSKIEAGKLELDDHAFELHEVVDGVSAMLAMEAHEKGLDLMVWVDDDVPSDVRGDGARIRQVLANLATNAVKFTHQGEVVIRVTVEPGAQIGNGIGSGEAVVVRFAVSDTGIGIDRGSADDIFDSFSQADTSTTREYGGTGLGLAISKQLVQLMGGRIGLESVPGSGSTFWFTVPVALAPREEGSAGPRRTNFAESRVLVIEDNPTSRTILEHQLTSWGMSCDTAAEPTEALGLLRDGAAAGRPYGLALIDFTLRDTSGLDLARAVQGSPELASTRLMMLSASAAEREASMQAGVHGYVTKPVRASRLGHEIARVLGAGQLVPMADAAARVPVPDRAGATAGRPVLVAEDKSVNQLVAVRMLEKLGFRADVASNGREAVEMHASGAYEAIFMDCQMPELDGYQATAAIRRHEADGRHTPIIAMTAHTLRGDRERCLDAGMDDYVGKPIRTSDLADVIARALGRGTQARSTNGAGTTASDGEVALLDTSRLDDVFGDDDEARASLLAQFIAQSRATIAALAEPIEAGDAEAVARLAHGLKGSAAVVGAERVSQLAGRLSDDAAAGHLEEAGRIHIALQSAFDATDKALTSSPNEMIR